MMKGIRAAFVQPIIDPVREAWFKHLASEPGIEFRVFALREQLSHRPGWMSRRDAGFEVEHVRSLLLRRRGRIEGAASSIARLRLVPVDLIWRLWRYRPDVVVVTNATELLQALAIRWMTGARVALSAEDTRLSFAHTGRKARLLKKSLLRRVDIFLAHSSAARDLLGDLGVPRAKIGFTPWAVDNAKLATWAKDADVVELRRKHGVHGVVFVTVGALIPRKGIDCLLEAWSLLPAELRDEAGLLVIGDGPERGRLERMATSRGLNSVRFLGHLPPRDVALCFAASDVFVLPTLEDVWGLVASEAMATGLPVLCSKFAGSSQDLIREGQNGFTFDPRDRNQFAAVLRDVLQRRAILPRMGRESREIIASFTIDRSVSSLVAALRQGVERTATRELKRGDASHF